MQDGSLLESAEQEWWLSQPGRLLPSLTTLPGSQQCLPHESEERSLLRNATEHSAWQVPLIYSDRWSASVCVDHAAKVDWMSRLQSCVESRVRSKRVRKCERGTDKSLAIVAHLGEHCEKSALLLQDLYQVMAAVGTDRAVWVFQLSRSPLVSVESKQISVSGLPSVRVFSLKPTRLLSRFISSGPRRNHRTLLYWLDKYANLRPKEYLSAHHPLFVPTPLGLLAQTHGLSNAHSISAELSKQWMRLRNCNLPLSIIKVECRTLRKYSRRLKSKLVTECSQGWKSRDGALVRVSAPGRNDSVLMDVSRSLRSATAEKHADSSLLQRSLCMFDERGVALISSALSAFLMLSCLLRLLSRFCFCFRV